MKRKLSNYYIQKALDPYWAGYIEGLEEGIDLADRSIDKNSIRCSLITKRDNALYKARKEIEERGKDET